MPNIRAWHDAEARKLLAPEPTVRPAAAQKAPAPKASPSTPAPRASQAQRRDESDLLGRLVGQAVQVTLRSGTTVAGTLLARTRYEMLVRREDGLEVLVEKHAADTVTPIRAVDSERRTA